MKAIFFDTNVFYDVKFDVDNPELAQVIALAKRLSIDLWISPITVREISAGIDRKIDALLDAYRNVSSILENTSDDTVLLDMSAVENARLDTHEQVQLFFNESKFKMLDYSLLDDSDISKVFNDYFLQKGTFTPKKRSKNLISKEFPDAFQLELIRRSAFCGDRVGVVSKDIDFTEGLNGDNGIEKYPSLISLIKVLQSIKSGSYSYLNYLENEIYYRHTPDVNYETLFSRVVLDLPDVLEVDFQEAIKLLRQKGLVSCYS